MDKNSQLDRFEAALRTVLSPEAKKALDEDKKKRKAKKSSALGRASRDRD